MVGRQLAQAATMGGVLLWVGLSNEVAEPPEGSASPATAEHSVVEAPSSPPAGVPSSWDHRTLLAEVAEAAACGDFAGAHAILDEVEHRLATQPEDARARIETTLWRAEVLGQQLRLAAAAREFDRAVETTTRTWGARSLVAGRVSLHAGLKLAAWGSPAARSHLDRAVPALRAVLADDAQGRTRILTEAAHAHRLLGSWLEAEALYEEVVSADGAADPATAIEARDGLASCLRRRGERRQAVELAARAPALAVAVPAAEARLAARRPERIFAGL